MVLWPWSASHARAMSASSALSSTYAPLWPGCAAISLSTAAKVASAAASTDGDVETATASRAACKQSNAFCKILCPLTITRSTAPHRFSLARSVRLLGDFRQLEPHTCQGTLLAGYATPQGAASAVVNA